MELVVNESKLQVLHLDLFRFPVTLEDLKAFYNLKNLKDLTLVCLPRMIIDDILIGLSTHCYDLEKLSLDGELNLCAFSE